MGSSVRVVEWREEWGEGEEQVGGKSSYGDEQKVILNRREEDRV
nr:hypothetical protein [Tanacetum cinerariifolium]